MAIAFRDSGTATGTGTQGTIAKSTITGLADGDIVLVLMHKDQASAGGSFSASSGTTGWTLAKENLWASGGRNHGAALFYKVITSASGEPTDWQFESSQSDDWSMVSYAFSGVDNASPIDAVVTENAGTDDDSPDAPDITTASANAMVVTMWSSPASGGDRTGATFTAPTGFGSSVSAVRGGSFAVVAHKDEATAGGKVYGSWSGTGGGFDASEEYITWTVSLKAAASDPWVGRFGMTMALQAVHRSGSI